MVLLSASGFTSHRNYAIKVNHCTNCVDGPISRMSYKSTSIEDLNEIIGQVVYENLKQNYNFYLMQ